MSRRRRNWPADGAVADPGMSRSGSYEAGGSAESAGGPG